MTRRKNTAEYLAAALHAAGVNHIFGIPGDYALGLFDVLTKSPIDVINTCDEQGAGFAADAYARIKGIGAVCVTYGVGGLKLVNSTAQAFAERSPVVVISGAPGIGEQQPNALLHHRVRDFDTQVKIFSEITAAQTVLSDPACAAQEIDRVLAVAQNTKRPVYIEIPRDCVLAPCSPAPVSSVDRIVHDPETLDEALTEIRDMLNHAENPVILAGVEIHRFNLHERLKEFLAASGIPFATTIMGKSLLTENTPGFLGVYCGALSREAVRNAVESSDCLLMLGAMLTDLNTGIFTTNMGTNNVISATADLVNVRRHTYPGVTLAMVLNALVDQGVTPREQPEIAWPAKLEPFNAIPDAPITIARLFECLNRHLNEKTAIIADPGDALFAATDLTIHGGAEFIACAYYASLGFAVPGAIGMQLAMPERRPIILVGDGAFQMTGVELSTAVRYGLSPIVVVLDNHGYGTERPMLDGPFNDVQPWNFAKLPELINGGTGVVVTTEAEFQQELEDALADHGRLAILHVAIATGDLSPALERLTATLKARV